MCLRPRPLQFIPSEPIKRRLFVILRIPTRVHQSAPHLPQDLKAQVKGKTHPHSSPAGNNLPNRLITQLNHPRSANRQYCQSPLFSQWFQSRGVVLVRLTHTSFGSGTCDESRQSVLLAQYWGSFRTCRLGPGGGGRTMRMDSHDGSGVPVCRALRTASSRGWQSRKCTPADGSSSSAGVTISARVGRSGFRGGAGTRASTEGEVSAAAVRARSLVSILEW